MTGDASGDRLAAVVDERDAEAAIAALRAEGVYDESRRVADHGGGAVALPVVAAPDETDVRAVVETDLPPRERGLVDLLAERGWTDEELAAAPGSWAVVGDVVLVEVGDAPRPGEVGEALLELQDADTVLARAGVEGPTRDPDVTVLAGSGDTETVHREHGTAYALDLSSVMFSPGNKAERARMGEVVTEGERAFDMFAGVGYFALPMARAGATVTAAEIDPEAYRYLVENAVLNDVDDRIRPVLGDCRDVDTVADRVVMGHFDAHDYLDAALAALSPGGVVHYHEATPEAERWDRPVGRVEAAAGDRGRPVEVLDRRVVKSHSPGVDHVVVDARFGEKA